jgi:SAM-dependent methyltransferase
VGDRKFSSILDIGAGDGSLSLQLLNADTRLTLVDLSSRMLGLARAKVPAGSSGNLDTINEDFMSAKFTPRSFDLILCVGVLAHVDSPPDFSAKVVSLLKPGGCIIAECTDSVHFMGRFITGLQWLWSGMKPETYPLNKLTGPGVRDLFCRLGMKVETEFRYGIPPPGMNRILGHNTLYRMVRLAFGNCKRNRIPWLGNQYIFLFHSPSP